MLSNQAARLLPVLTVNPSDSGQQVRQLQILIIGAGFSGIGLAIRLKQVGIKDFLILEAERGVGGTWWLNRYPGCACDVQSHLYSLSFVPKADWSRQFAGRAEIQRYLADCVDRHALADHIVLSTRVEQARWRDGERVWQVLDQRGNVYRSRVLVSAIGGLSRAAWPAIPGLDEFAGSVIHSQRWPEHLELRDRRIAVIGTGASAVQFVPHLQREAAQLDVYQRSAQWILPKPDRPIRPWQKTLYRRVPAARRLVRLGLFALLESRLPAFARWPRLTAYHRHKALAHLRGQVRDPALQRKLLPDYAMGCKRVLMSNDYYPAIAAPNVNLVTIPIAHIDSRGITDREGHHRAADLLILGTGFQAADPVPPGLIIGRDSLDLATAWRHGPVAYKGSTVPGFPNFFTLLGPNTALGHNSVVLMIEGQIRYVISALRWMQRHGHETIEVRPRPTQAWDADLQHRLKQSVWQRGRCSSWYQHPDSGRIPTLWPRFTFSFRWLLRKFDPAAYRVDRPSSTLRP